MSETIKLKPLRTFNDYVAVIRDIAVPDGMEIAQEMLQKISNEGVVCGIGPDIQGRVELGDKVIFAKKLYLEMQPESGNYAGRSVVILKMADLLVHLGKSDKFEITNEA